MGVKILEIKRESCPAVRFIGKKYEDRANWEEWWKNNWFMKLNTNQCIPFNGDAYIGAVHMVRGMPEYWIGMFFSVNTKVLEGFEYVDIEPQDYAVYYLYDKENSTEFYKPATRNMCLERLEEHKWKQKENGWCFERYRCPGFTTPDEKGNVILDYGISIES